MSDIFVFFKEAAIAEMHSGILRERNSHSSYGPPGGERTALPLPPIAPTWAVPHCVGVCENEGYNGRVHSVVGVHRGTGLLHLTLNHRTYADQKESDGTIGKERQR